MRIVILVFIQLFCFELFGQGYLRVEGGRLISGATGYVVSNNCHWVNNDATANLTLTNNTTKFIGGTANYIGGSQPTPFYNLRIAKTSADVYLAQHQQVNNQIYMESGDLDLRNYNITLSSTASLANETYDKRIKATNGTNDGEGTGYLTTTRTDPSGNVANLGLNFTPVGGGLGSTEIRRGHLKQQGSGSFTANYSAYRYYRVIPTTMRQLTVNNFYYFVDGANPSAGIAELNVHPEANLQMFQQVQYWNGSTNPIYWEPRSTTPVPASDYVSSTTTSNAIMLNYIMITLASTTVPLPVEYLMFTANCQEGVVHIAWKTASETNNAGFYVEKSNDGYNWFNLQFVVGNGTSNQINSYSVVDNSPFNQTYYRLKQIDSNGEVTFSNIVSANCQSQSYVEDVLPLNSGEGSFSVIVRGEPDKTYELLFTNVLGQQLLSKKIKLTSLQEVVPVYEQIFNTGIYYVTMITANKRISKPILFNKQ